MLRAPRSKSRSRATRFQVRVGGERDRAAAVGGQRLVIAEQRAGGRCGAPVAGSHESCDSRRACKLAPRSSEDASHSSRNGAGQAAVEEEDVRVAPAAAMLGWNWSRAGGARSTARSTAGVGARRRWTPACRTRVGELEPPARRGEREQRRRCGSCRPRSAREATEASGADGRRPASPGRARDPGRVEPGTGPRCRPRRRRSRRAGRRPRRRRRTGHRARWPRSPAKAGSPLSQVTPPSCEWRQSTAWRP